jgi:NAD(P)H-hydrate epimerase
LHLKTIINLSEDADAVAIGGGLGRNMQTFMFVRMFLARVNKPCVIDADAIHAVAKSAVALKSAFVLTPHSYEFFVLDGAKPGQNIIKRAEQAKELAKKLKATVLLKGHVDVISDCGQAALNKTGNPCMTKGGTGDTLAGICGALLARGIKPFDAACAAAWINGAAGDAALRSLGPGFLVSEMTDFIPKAIWG